MPGTAAPALVVGIDGRLPGFCNAAACLKEQRLYRRINDHRADWEYEALSSLGDVLPIDRLE